jgi:hypothetical protein
MPAAVRYTWMFRTAAVLYVTLGLCFLWSYGLTDRFAAYRPHGLAAGVLFIGIGIFLFRRARAAIGLSAFGSAVLCLCATFAVPAVHGPVILFFALLAILAAIYTALSLRVIFGNGGDATPRTPGA